MGAWIARFEGVGASGLRAGGAILTGAPSASLSGLDSSSGVGTCSGCGADAAWSVDVLDMFGFSAWKRA